MRYAVATPIGPGRGWLIDAVWLDALDSLGLPKRETRICVANNTGNTRLTRQIAGKLRERGWGEARVAVERQAGSGIKKRLEGLSSHMAGLYTRLLGMAGDAEYTVALETDVTPPGREELGGEWPVERLLRAMEPDVAMVGTPVPSRWRDCAPASVYTVSDIVQWPRVKHRPKPRVEGVQDVHAHGHCLVAMRTKPVRNAGFTATPNLDGTGGPGHEWGNQKRLLLSGWRIVVDWSVKPKHWKSPTEWARIGQ